MFCTEVSVVANASPKNIWALWSDVGSWSKWDPDVEHCQLKQGSFQKGAKALLKPRGGPKVKIEIVDCVIEQIFVSHSFLPLTTIVFHHEVTPQKQGQSLITHRVEFNGLLAPMFYFIMGRNIVKGLPKALQNLARLAETQ
jgi:hypothetical protein